MTRTNTTLHNKLLYTTIVKSSEKIVKVGTFFMKTLKKPYILPHTCKRLN